MSLDTWKSQFYPVDAISATNDPQPMIAWLEKTIGHLTEVTK